MFRNLSPEAININRILIEKLRLAKIGNFEGMDISVSEFIDFAENISRVRTLFESFGIKIGGWILPFNIGDREEKFNAGFEKLKDYLKFAKDISAFRIYTYFLPFSDEIPFKENYILHKERTKKICELMEKYECKLGIEFIGTDSFRRNHKYEFIWNFQQMIEFIEDVKMENLGILIDSWHLYSSDGKHQDIKKLKGEKIICVHVNDAPPISKKDLKDDEKFLPGETGVIDIVGLLKVLKEIGYDGPITPEPFNKRITELPDEIAVRLVGGYLLKIWEKAFK
jgi:sugar phosphate isomerase/epimerase